MRIFPAIAFCAALALPAHAAVLRGGTTLGAASVRLSDLFDGVARDLVIGSGPEPGGQIVVESAQLGAIARQFNVDWRPTSTADRIVLERPGKPFPREQAIAALRLALRVAGAAADAEIEMPGYLPPVVPNDATPHADVGQLDYAASDGRFTAVLSITDPGMAPVHARLSGHVVEMSDVPVATHRLTPGTIIGPADLQMTRLRTAAVRGEVVQFSAQAIGLALRRAIGPGAPLLLADLGRPQLVQKGEPVQMQLDTPGLSLSARGVAMESGAAGERVRVLNVQSRAVMEAEVLGAGQVRVSGTTPVFLAPGAAVPVRIAAR